MENVLHVIIEWIDGRPIIDGSQGFATREKCLKHLETLPSTTTASRVLGKQVVRTIAGITINDDLVLMPKRLTAENGAKALLIGEFTESVEVEIEDDRKTVEGIMVVPVEWTTIKDIYKKVVEFFTASN